MGEVVVKVKSRTFVHGTPLYVFDIGLAGGWIFLDPFPLPPYYPCPRFFVGKRPSGKALSTILQPFFATTIYMQSSSPPIRWFYVQSLPAMLNLGLQVNQ
jgi:hypothetical protein